MPHQAMGGGVNVRCLINSDIKINGLVQIDQASLYRVALGNNEVARRVTEQNVNSNLTATENGTPQNMASIAADGVYIVKAIDYTGENAGRLISSISQRKLNTHRIS